MYRRTGNDWSGDPLLAAAIHLSIEQMLGELPSDQELSARYSDLSGLDQKIAEAVAQWKLGR